MKKLILISLLISVSSLEAIRVQPMQGRHYYLGGNQGYTQQSTQNLHHGFNQLHKYAVKGDTHSQYQLALMFHYGNGIRQNAELARLWFTRAAKKGHPQAQDVLYRFYSAKKPSYYSPVALTYNRNFRTFR